jgi:hypothetical protein
MALKVTDVKAGAVIENGSYEYHILHELEDDRDWVVYKYKSPYGSGVRYDAARKADFLSFTLTEQFFKVGEKYAYSTSPTATKYIIKSIEEQDGSKVALAYSISDYDQLGWTYFEQDEYDNDLTKVS